jgi:hypothetical protein
VQNLAFSPKRLDIFFEDLVAAKDRVEGSRREELITSLGRDRRSTFFGAAVWSCFSSVRVKVDYTP